MRRLWGNGKAGLLAMGKSSQGEDSREKSNGAGKRQCLQFSYAACISREAFVSVCTEVDVTTSDSMEAVRKCGR